MSKWTEYVGRYQAVDEFDKVWEVDYWRETIEVKTRAGTTRLPGTQILKTVVGELSLMPDPDDKRKLVIFQSGKVLSLRNGIEPPW